MSVIRALDIPSRYRGPAFRAIVDIAREDPVLSRVVRSWRAREGKDDELSPPSTNQMPMLAFSPIPNPNAILGVDEQRINFAVLVQVFVQGTCVEDILALWEAVEDSYVDQKPFRNTTVRQYLCGVIDPAPAGVMMLRPYAPAFMKLDITKPQKAKFQMGDGTLTCFLRRPAAKSFLPI